MSANYAEFLQTDEELQALRDRVARLEALLSTLQDALHDALRAEQAAHDSAAQARDSAFLSALWASFSKAEVRRV